MLRKTMKLQKNQIIELTIDKLVYGGKGIASLPTENGNFKVFVGDCIPGDKVRVRLVKIKSGYAEGVAEEIISESSLRIKPKCEHFAVCGGCCWQNLSYDNQLAYKEEQVKDSLKHIGGFASEVVKKIIPSEDHFFYRNKMEFSFGDNKNMPLSLGFHPRGMRHDVFQLNNCYLQAEETGHIVNKVFNFFNERKISRFKYKNNEGCLRNLIVKHSKTDDSFLLNLVISGNEYSWLEEFVELIKSLPKTKSLYLTKILALSGQKTKKQSDLIWGEKTLSETLKVRNKEYFFKIDPDSFFQPNTKQAQILYNEVIEAIDNVECKKNCVFDLYCGTGTISLIVSQIFSKVYGLEINENAVNDAKHNAVENNVENVEFLCGDVTILLPKIALTPDLIIVDPPRAGLSESAIYQLADLKPKGIVYVSCNPSTLARDAKILSREGFVLKFVQPVDMFPQTYHIEQVALLVKI